MHLLAGCATARILTFQKALRARAAPLVPILPYWGVWGLSHWNGDGIPFVVQRVWLCHSPHPRLLFHKLPQITSVALPTINQLLGALISAQYEKGNKRCT